MTVHVYHGPTIEAATIHSILSGARLHAPVKHGDLLRLEVVPGDTVLIIDGLFHSTGSVRHKEILDLLSRGVRVVGSSSMGALRAAELHPYGMVGIGWIFEAYRDGLIEADDEVAVAHTSDDFRQVVEPLVNIRYTLDTAIKDGVITPAVATALLEAARSLPYTSRTWTLIRRVAAKRQPEIAGELDRLTDWHGCRYAATNIKHLDALEALRTVAADRVAVPDTSGWTSGAWRNSYLQQWTARCRGTSVDGSHIPFLAELQYQQVYDPDFPRRSRLFALRWIAGDQRASAEQAETRALSVTADNGITVRDLDPERLAHWLSPAELAELPEREKLLRALVRTGWSTTIRPADRTAAGELLNPAIPSAEIAAAAFRFNRQVASEGPNRTIHHLRPERIRAHLACTWGVPADDTEALTAAARDRMFDSIDTAIEIGRSFYLWTTHQDRAPAASPSGT